MNVLDAVDDAWRLALRATVEVQERLVVVDSPPGAGKTELVCAVVAVAVKASRKIVVIAPKVSQAEDLARRLKRDYGVANITYLHAKDRSPAADLISLGVHATDSLPNAIGASHVVVSNAVKLAASSLKSPTELFDLMIVDEAYQLTWSDFANVSRLARSYALVGDPGQLPPLVQSDTSRFEGAETKVHWAAPKEALRKHPSARRILLPATWRLPPDTVEFVQPSFYPGLPFVSAASDADRRLVFEAQGLRGIIDAALDCVSSGASIVGVLLPATEAAMVSLADDELSEFLASIVERILQRGPRWGASVLQASDIGCVDAHVASGAATTRHLRRRGISDVTVDTPEIWQGLQRPVMLLKHPLSGDPRPTGFDLDPGRLCVMTSRHQLACIVVGRDGIGGVLDAHSIDCASRPAGAEHAEWNGWRAHTHLWRTLEQRGRLFRVMADPRRASV